MSKHISKNISNYFSGKWGQQLLDHDKQSATDAHITSSKAVIQKPAEATGDLIGNKITNRITKVSKKLPQNNLEKVTDENEQEIPKETYVFRKKTRNYSYFKIKIIE